MWPAPALAEVMDKETAPWSPTRLMAALIVSAMCVVLRGRRTRGAASWVALVAAMGLAVAWATAGACDDFFSSDVGPAMRHELGRASIAYGAVLLLESAAPLVAVLLASGRRSQPSSRGSAV